MKYFSDGFHWLHLVEIARWALQRLRLHLPLLFSCQVYLLPFRFFHICLSFFVLLCLSFSFFFTFVFLSFFLKFVFLCGIESTKFAPMQVHVFQVCCVNVNYTSILYFTFVLIFFLRLSAYMPIGYDKFSLRYHYFRYFI